MNELRHNFKQNFMKEKFRFLDQIFSFINEMNIDDEKKDIFKDISEYLSNKDNCDYLLLGKILKSELSESNNKSKEELIESVSKEMDNITKVESFHSSEYHNSDQLKTIANEFKQINNQAKEILGNGVIILDGVDIIKTNEENRESYLETLEYVESIDLCVDIDENPSQDEGMDFSGDITDSFLESFDNIVCIFCENKNIILISNIEGYCPNCDKNFYIKNN